MSYVIIMVSVQGNGICDNNGQVVICKENFTSIGLGRNSPSLLHMPKVICLRSYIIFTCGLKMVAFISNVK